MKVCVVGAGAIGGWIAARLASSGNDVCLVARGAHLDAIRARGLTLISGEERQTFSLPASDRPEEFGVQDVVFIALKAHSIAAALPSLRCLVGTQTVVVPAINGIPWWYFYRAGGLLDGSSLACLDPDGAMLRALDSVHIVGCVVAAAAEVSAPGVVTLSGGNRLILGEPDNSLSDRLNRLADAGRAAGMAVTVSTDIRADIWAKLLGNLTYNPVAALTLARMGEINRNPGLLALVRAMMKEGMAVAEAHGVKISTSIDERIEKTESVGHAKTSMHQDIEKGRPLEVAAIIGSVAALARKAGVPSPMIDAVHALVEERARHITPS